MNNCFDSNRNNKKRGKRDQYQKHGKRQCGISSPPPATFLFCLYSTFDLRKGKLGHLERKRSGLVSIRLVTTKRKQSDSPGGGNERELFQMMYTLGFAYQLEMAKGKKSRDSSEREILARMRIDFSFDIFKYL